MKTYDVAITFTDATQVCAKSEDEAYELARIVFNENGLEGELDIIGIQEGEL